MRIPNWIRPVLAAALLTAAPVVAAAQVLTMEAVRSEAREGQGIGIELRLRLDVPAEFPFTAQVQLTGVDADGADFAPPVIPVTFLENDTLKHVTIDIVDDPVDEPFRETFVASVDSVAPLDPQTVPRVVNAAGSIPLTVIDDDNAFTVSARPGPEGGAVIVTIRQQHDSDTAEVVAAELFAGSATPGLDFEPWQKIARLPPGTTETTMAIGLMPDTVPEDDETFSIEMAHMGTGTATFDPAQLTGTILDETERGMAFRLPSASITVRLDVLGHTTTRQQQFEGYQVTLTRHPGGSRMTVTQPDRMDLEFQRVCTEDTDFEKIAEDIPGSSAEDIGAGNRTGWRGAYRDGSYEQVWTMFEQPDGSYSGFTRMSDSIPDGEMRGWGRWRLIPLDDAEDKPEVERLPSEPPAAQLPPEGVTDAVARQVAADLGMSAEEVRPYLSTSLGPDMTRGDGDSARAVEVEIWLDADGRPLRADRATLGPCDEGYGQQAPPAQRLRYRFGTAGAGIYAQGVVQDVETGVLEEAYMEDLDAMSNDLDTAAERAHGGLSPNLAPPQ